MTKQLDYQAFPHLIDLILSFSSPSVIRTFRLTCKHYEDAITTHLGRHLIHNSDGSLTSKNRILVYCRHTYRLTFTPDTPNPQSRRLASLLRHAKTLDIHYRSLEGLIHLLPPLELLRNASGMPKAPLPSCHTAVCRSLMRLPPQVERLVFSWSGLYRVKEENESSPPRVREIVILCIQGLPMSVSTLCCFTAALEIECEVITVVDPPEEITRERVERHVESRVNSTFGDRVVRLKRAEWRFVREEEFVRSLSGVEREFILG